MYYCINLTLLDYSVVYSIPTQVSSKCKSTSIDINIYTRVNGHDVAELMYKSYIQCEASVTMF